MVDRYLKKRFNRENVSRVGRLTFYDCLVFLKAKDLEPLSGGDCRYRSKRKGIVYSNLAAVSIGEGKALTKVASERKTLRPRDRLCVEQSVFVLATHNCPFSISLKIPHCP